MKTIASLTTALIASVALAGFSAPAAASLETGNTPPDGGNFVCTVKSADGPSQNLLKVGTKFEVLVTKTEVTFSNDFKLPFGYPGTEFKHASGSWSRNASWVDGPFKFMFTQRYFVPDSNPSASEMTYSFMFFNKKVSDVKVTRWGECSKIFK